mgnify:FL=1
MSLRMLNGLRIVLPISRKCPDELILTQSEVYDTMRWLPNRQAAEELGVTVRTLYHWRREGMLLPGIHYGRSSIGRSSRIYIDVDAVQGLMAATALK